MIIPSSSSSCCCCCWCWCWCWCCCCCCCRRSCYLSYLAIDPLKDAPFHQKCLKMHPFTSHLSTFFCPNFPWIPAVLGFWMFFTPPLAQTFLVTSIGWRLGPHLSFVATLSWWRSAEQSRAARIGLIFIVGILWNVTFNIGVPQIIKVMDDHGLVLKPMVTWGPLFWETSKWSSKSWLRTGSSGLFTAIPTMECNDISWYICPSNAILPISSQVQRIWRFGQLFSSLKLSRPDQWFSKAQPNSFKQTVDCRHPLT